MVSALTIRLIYRVCPCSFADTIARGFCPPFGISLADLPPVILLSRPCYFLSLGFHISHSRWY